jgi:hypothetical protein
MINKMDFDENRDIHFINKKVRFGMKMVYDSFCKLSEFKIIKSLHPRKIRL